MSRFIRLLLIFPIALLLASTMVSAQKKPKAAKPAPSKTASAASPDTTQAKAPTKDVAALATVALEGTPTVGGDYVPCKFTYNELQALVAPERKVTLTAEDAEKLTQAIFTEVERQAAAGLLTQAQAQSIINNFKVDSLVGLTASQATNLLINAVSGTLKPQPESTDDANAKKAAVEAKMSLVPGTSQAAAAAAVEAESKKTETNATKATAAVGTVIDTAQKSIEALIRPVDVGCAMSILSWFETDRAYGRTIANHYIAVQVVVRNLNRDQQFVLHDVEVGVSVDPGGRIGRFYSGRDKTIVRALSLNQESFDLRNLTVGISEGVGAVMSAASLIYGGALADATNVFVSGYLPSLTKTWKDSSIDQLNLLNDTGFSSSSSSQMVVPKAGTTMFVTFIPSKQFEQGWWTQPCATRQFFGPVADVGGRKIFHLNPQDPKDKVAGSENISATGYDVDRALESCLRDPKLQAAHTSAAAPDGLFVDGKARAYRKWDGNSLAIFQELSTTVVAGLHILDDTALEATLTGFNCGSAVEDKTGKLKLPTGSSQVTCTAKGTNLVKLKAIRLRNSADPLDADTVDGSVSMGGGDEDTATVVFQTDAIGRLTASDYSIRLVDKATGLESSTGQALHLDLTPQIMAITPSTIDSSKLPVASLDVTGYHLGTVQTMTLTSPTAGAAPITLSLAAAPVSTDTTLHFATSTTTSAGITPTDWTKLGASDATISITFATTDVPSMPVASTLKFVAPKAAAQ